MSKDSKSLEFLTQALAKRFQNPGQAYLRYNVVWKPEEWIPKYRPREAGGMDAQAIECALAHQEEEENPSQAKSDAHLR